MRKGIRRTVLSTAVVASALAALLPGRTSAPVTRLARPPAGIAVLHEYRIDDVPHVDTEAPAKVVAAPVEADPVAKVVPEAEKRLVAPEPAPADEPLVGSVEARFTEHVAPASSGPSASSSGKCPKATTCAAYLLQRARWKTDSTGKLTIPWKFNDEGRRNLRAPAGLLESALRASMAEWHKWNSNVNFAYSGASTAKFGARGRDGSCADGTNVIGWARLDRDVIAETMTCMDASGRVVRDADLALNVTYHWENIEGTPDSRHSFDIRSIVMHELGHVLSIGHPDPSAGLYQTMMGNARYGEVRKRTPALGDIIAIQTAYPCGSGDTCPRKGIVDD